MADEDQKLCDNCHERPGTNHICNAGRAGEDRSLCDVCLAQDSAVGGLMQRFQEAIRTGHCKYCGAPAELSWGGSFSPIFGDHFNLVCKTCFDDLTGFVRLPENDVLDVPPGDEAAMRNKVSLLPNLMKRQDEYMRQRVSERKSK
ncbi:MAG: hypothetical protein P4L87_10445 [Formivibrio sp.]|nr:hypothetical protein [Formivibrio sp.]